MPDFMEMLARAARDETPAKTYTHAQALERLSLVFKALTENTETFTPGDVIYHRFPAHSTFKSDLAAMPAMFLKYLDAPLDVAALTREHGFSDPDDIAGFTSAAVLDCVILCFAADAGEDKDGVIIPYLQDSRNWTRQSPEARKAN